MLTLTDIFGIFRSIVAGYPYDPCGGLNTFAVFDQREQLDAPNLGKTYEDFVAGTFWARNWFLSGASPSTLQKEYGILALEHKSADMPDIMSPGELLQPVYVNVLQTVACDTCPGTCPQTAEAVDASNFRILQRVLAELHNFYLYQVTPEGGGPAETYNAWLSEGQAAAMQADGALMLQRRQLSAWIQQDGHIRIYKTFFGVDRVRSAAVELVFRTCEPEDFAFQYATPEVQKLGVVKCCQ